MSERKRMAERRGTQKSLFSVPRCTQGSLRVYIGGLGYRATVPGLHKHYIARVAEHHFPDADCVTLGRTSFIRLIIEWSRGKGSKRQNESGRQGEGKAINRRSPYPDTHQASVDMYCHRSSTMMVLSHAHIMA